MSNEVKVGLVKHYQQKTDIWNIIQNFQKQELRHAILSSSFMC